MAIIVTNQSRQLILCGPILYIFFHHFSFRNSEHDPSWQVEPESDTEIQLLVPACQANRPHYKTTEEGSQVARQPIHERVRHDGYVHTGDGSGIAAETFSATFGDD